MTSIFDELDTLEGRIEGLDASLDGAQSVLSAF